MKPLRELSTEQIEELADDELIDLVANDIQSSRAGGDDLEEACCARTLGRRSD